MELLYKTVCKNISLYPFKLPSSPWGQLVLTRKMIPVNYCDMKSSGDFDQLVFPAVINGEISMSKGTSLWGCPFPNSADLLQQVWSNCYLWKGFILLMPVFLDLIEGYPLIAGFNWDLKFEQHILSIKRFRKKNSHPCFKPMLILINWSWNPLMNPPSLNVQAKK